MQEILKKLMGTRCVAMHNPSMRCYGKGCNGQCAHFQVALDAIVTKACGWLKENLSEGYDADNYPMVRCYDIDIEGFIKEFSREMEG